VLLALFLLRLGRGRRIAWAGSAVVITATVPSLTTAATEMKNANTYNLVFLAVLPESRNPAADVAALGLDPGTEDYSRTGAWGPNSAFDALEERGTIGQKVNLVTVLRFYLSRLTRLWRHIQTTLPIATLLRPEYGNFERSAGYAPGARSEAFAIWSGFHESALSRVAKFLLFLLPVPAVMALIQRIRTGSSQLRMEFFALLGMCCITAFLAAIFGDAWDNVRHLFLFNFLLDSYLFSAVAFAWSAARTMLSKPLPRLADSPGQIV